MIKEIEIKYDKSFLEAFIKNEKHIGNSTKGFFHYFNHLQDFIKRRRFNTFFEISLSPIEYPNQNYLAIIYTSKEQIEQSIFLDNVSFCNNLIRNIAHNLNVKS